MLSRIAFASADRDSTARGGFAMMTSVSNAAVVECISGVNDCGTPVGNADGMERELKPWRRRLRLALFVLSALAWSVTVTGAIAATPVAVQLVLSVDVS